jgi:DNA polymerase III epsilon subunit-like protein
MRCLALDTETTGLPSRSPAGTVRIMQLGFVVCDITPAGVSIVHEYDQLLRLPPGTTIDPVAERIHGISREQCEAGGVEVADAIMALTRWVTSPSPGTPVTIVGHSIDFDFGIIAQEARRLGLEHSLRALGVATSYCTMEKGTQVCRLPRPNALPGFKYPKLTELFSHLFPGEPVPPKTHSAIVDAHLALRCYLAMEHPAPRFLPK